MSPVVEAGLRRLPGVSISDEPFLTNVTARLCGPAFTGMRAFKSFSFSVSLPMAALEIVKVWTGSRSSSTSISCGRRIAQPADDSCQIASEQDLDLVLAVLGKRIRRRHAAARANRQPGQLIFLREIGRQAEWCRSAERTACSRPPGG